MKIIYFANSRIPTEKAHGYQIMKMCEVFASTKANLELILPNRINKDFVGVDLFDYYKVRHNFKIKKIKSFDPIHFIKPSKSQYIRIQTLFFYLGIVLYLVFKKNKTEYIFYTRDEFLLPILQMFSKKVVWEAHCLPKNKKYYFKYWHRCLKIITISPYIKDELRKDGINGDNIMVAADAVDLDLFLRPKETKKDLRKKIELPEEKKIVLYTGHLYGWKGVQVLADVADYLKDYYFLFVGGTAFDVNQFICINGSKDNISIIHHQPHDKMPLFINAADILVIPNLASKKISKYYTSPLKLFEYLSTLKPIIASDLPSLKEAAGEFAGVFYFKPGDTLDLANKIKKIDINQEYQRDLKKFTWQKRAERIVDFIS
jgi:glycosyltransferase involved in cell wall biosynthesis